ncbi:MAG: amidohydrolase family protein [Chloroflexi bacterium]|nr:amidohydrolase family protein [Chloroflexota bacterium]
MNDSQIAQEFLATGCCTSCPIIDLHGHYGHFSGIYMPNHDSQQMIATLDRCGVERIVSSGHTALADMVRGNQEIAEVTAAFPGRWNGYLVFNPNYPEEAAHELDLYDERKTLVGIKFHPSFHQYPINGERYKPALEFAAERHLLLLSHTWGGSAYDDVPKVAQIAEQYPEIDILCGHSFYGNWDAGIALAARMPNVYLELTAAYAVNGLIERVVEQAGEDKIVFGCDLPWFDPHYAIGCIVFAHITEQARRKILRETALRLLRPRLRTI